MRSDVPLFYREETIELIDWLADTPHLTVYAGAGVSIDRTGADWGGLVGGLLSKVVTERRVDASDDVVRHLLAHWGPARCGTIVANRLGYPHRSVGTVRQQLRDALYPADPTARGRLLGTLARYAYQRAAAGLVTTFVTTNYDVGLEEELDAVAKLLPDESRIPLVTTSVDDDFEFGPEHEAAMLDRSTIDIYYLHGRVSRGDIEENEGPVPVLGEREYALRTTAARSLIAGALRTSRMVILGSSLVDPPLIEALLSESLQPETPTRHKILFSRQATEWRLAEREDSPKSLESVAVLRMHEMGVEPSFVDFYSQIAQVFNEATVRLDNGSGPEHLGYVTRLGRWWDSWSSAVHESPVSAADGVKEIQRIHHRTVIDQIGYLRRLLRIDPGSVLRMQVFVRWAPDEVNRTFRLWVSSNGPISDLDAMPRHAIEWDSRSPAVRTFCEGRSCLFGPLDESRWRGGTIATPIWTDRFADMPLGVVVLQSSETPICVPRLVPRTSRAGTGGLELFDWDIDVRQHDRKMVKLALRAIGGQILSPG